MFTENKSYNKNNNTTFFKKDSNSDDISYNMHKIHSRLKPIP